MKKHKQRLMLGVAEEGVQPQQHHSWALNNCWMHCCGLSS